MKKFRTLLAYGDVHIPFNDFKACKILLDIIKDAKPDIIIDMGDSINASQISDYDKSVEELSGLQEELDSDFAFRNLIKKASPKSEKILLESNHLDKRLQKQKSKNHWLSDLDCMSVSSLLRLNELGWNLKREYQYSDKLIFVHGDDVAGGSTFCPINGARKLVKENSCSVVKAHSHTTGFEIHRHLNANHYAIQIGTLHDLHNASYIKHNKLSNWSQSFGVFYLADDDSHFHYVPVVVNEGTAIFNGKVYS